MSEIVVSMAEFKQMVTERGTVPFESGDLVAIPYGGHIIKAYKRSPARLFKRSIPMQAIGYSGVAHWWMRDFRGREYKHD